MNQSKENNPNKTKNIDNYRIECYLNPVSKVAKYNIVAFKEDSEDIQTVYMQLPEYVNGNFVKSWFPSIRVVREDYYLSEQKERKYPNTR